MNKSNLIQIGVILRANEQIGTGHLMRIKSLLPKLKEHAHLTLYVYNFAPVLKPLCSDYDDIVTFETKEDILSHLKDKLAQGQSIADLFIIDDYAIDKGFESELYPYSKIFVIDDLANREHQCHMLLDQTLFTKEQEYQKLCPQDCQLLLGSQYSLTKECFYPQYFDFDHHSTCSCLCHQLPFSARAIALANKAQHKDIKQALNTTSLILPKVLVNFGGADPAGACLLTFKAVVSEQLYQHYDFYFLLGAANKDFDLINKLLSDLPADTQKRIKLISHCNDVADLLYRFDLAIGAYGGMFRERIAAAIPTIGVEIADNQAGAQEIVKHLQIGLSLTLDELHNGKCVTKALTTLTEQADTYTKNCQAIYDGQGLNHIVAKMLSLLA